MLRRGDQGFWRVLRRLRHSAVRDLGQHEVRRAGCEPIRKVNFVLPGERQVRWRVRREG